MHSLTGSVTLRGVTDLTPTSPVPYVPGPVPLAPQQPLAAAPISGPNGTSTGQPVRVGDITISGTLIHTPVGAFDRGRTRWVLGGAMPFQQSCPTWATVSAYLLIPCTGFLSLLFLLVKETDVWSSTLRVADGIRIYETTIYSRSREDYERIRGIVEWAQRPGFSPASS